MCDRETEYHNGLVEDEDLILYRVCPTRDCFDETKEIIQQPAFYKRQSDQDGLSLAPTPQEARDSLNSGHGVARIRAGDVYALNRGLELRYDTRNRSHIVICKMPCIFVTEERRAADEVASELAAIAKVECNKKFRKS